jgi:hypothetical protein
MNTNADLISSYLSHGGPVTVLPAGTARGATALLNWAKYRRAGIYGRPTKLFSRKQTEVVPVKAPAREFKTESMLIPQGRRASRTFRLKKNTAAYA